MKKLVFSAMAAFCMLSANADVVPELSFGVIKANAGETVDAKIYLTNDEDVNSVAFVAYMPQGFAIALDEGDYWNGVSGELCDRAAKLRTDINNGAFATSVTDAGFEGMNRVKWTMGSSKGKITPGTGAIYVMYIEVADDVEDGIYPIYMTDIKAKNSKTSTGFEKQNYTSYIVVGTPTAEQVLKVKGALPGAVLEDLAAETAIASLDLSTATAVNGEFPYIVGRAVTAPAITADVKVVAGLNGGKYGSLCSPVALPGVKCYKFTGASGDVATFTEVDNVPANEVVIIDAAVDAKVAGATLASVENGNAAAGRLYVAPDGSELRRAGNTVKVPALRGTWDIAGGSNLRIALDTPTGIKMIGTANEVFGNTYDLQGRQVENAQNGVYVVNGKKQFVK